MEQYIPKSALVGEIDKETIELAKESVSGDLEDAATKYGTDEFPSLCGGCKHVPVDAFKAGANWQKEQFLAKAVDGVVHHLEKCGVASVHYTDPIGAPMAYYISPEGLSAGDKVKIIVIKEN